jgi:predicted RNA-binding protein YlqC (UPF0109 family)
MGMRVRIANSIIELLWVKRVDVDKVLAKRGKVVRSIWWCFMCLAVEVAGTLLATAM